MNGECGRKKDGITERNGLIWTKNKDKWKKEARRFAGMEKKLYLCSRNQRPWQKKKTI